jgi:hypothetical protein
MTLRKSVRWIVLAIAAIAPWLTGCKVACREPECPFFEPESRREDESPSFRPGSATDESQRAGTAYATK